MADGAQNFLQSPEGYRAFLEAKKPIAAQAGFEVVPGDVNPALKPFVRAIVPWALRGGRRAIFSRFGLHKTSTQLELARLARTRVGAVPLIILPLGVRHEFFADARDYFTGEHAVRLKFIRTTAEIDEREDVAGSGADAGAPPLIYLTNYESVREGKIDPDRFGFVSLDEAAVLRGFGGTKTFRNFMAQLAGDDRASGVKSEGIRYRFVATATPSPNDYIELLAYAAFLGVMDVGQAKTRFFRRDSEKADRLTIHPHKEREFWLWVASWALFVQRPSDLGFSDDGYALPPVTVRWHEIPSDHSRAGEERDGQARMFRNAAIGVSSAAAEKRDSLPARIAKMREIIAEEPAAHRIIWHDLEAERHAIEAALPGARSIFGGQRLEENETTAIAFKEGRLQYLAAKPQMSGAGNNFQKHCHRALFLGIGFKFHDFIQGVHRIVRFGQERPCTIDLIYSEAEREVRRSLEQKWARHDETVGRMSEIIREHGLSEAAFGEELARSIGVERREASGDGWLAVNNDCVDEVRRLSGDSVDLIVTSIPFSTQYEYTPSYNDFGHTDDDRHFWRQMDFLTPELRRVLRPGRVAAIHVKDRIVPGGISGLGFQTVSPFSDDCVAHFRRHGWAFLARKTVVTDVVRENNQTYRLGWTEQCKDGSRMGAGLPEYLLLFRKPPSDRSDGYADVPVVKSKAAYTRGRWQLDAHGFMRSSGDRQVRPEELVGLAADVIYKLWRAHSQTEVYDFEEHVACGEALERAGQLPPTFMLLPPHSWHPDVWSDVTRMRTLNANQAAKGAEMHLCPLQFDIVDRAIAQFTMEGETVLDPFGGLMTVPYRALKLRRQGIGIELNPAYWRDGVAYCRAAEAEMAVPSLFDLIEAETAAKGAAA